MNRKAYSSDLTDAEWALLTPFIPLALPSRRPRSTDMREMLDAIFYILRGSCAWRLLPHKSPKWKTVYHYMRAWRKAGLWEHIHGALRKRARLRAGREAEPSACIIDSQSLRRRNATAYTAMTTRRKSAVASVISSWIPRVYCSRRTFMQPTSLIATAHRSCSATLAGAFPRLRHVWADMGYRGHAVEWIKEQMGWTVEIVKRPSKWGRYPVDVEPEPLPAWTTLSRRWVVERTFTWIGRYRRMSKDYEYLTENSESFIYAAMIRLMLKRLTRAPSEAG